MGVRICTRLEATPLLIFLCLANFASSKQRRFGRLVTRNNKEIVFDSNM